MLTNVPDFIFRNAGSLSNQPALRYFPDLQSDETIYTWSDFLKITDKLAENLRAFGVRKQDNVAIFSPNMPHWIIADLAIMKLNAVTVPIFATNTAKQAGYILNETQAELIFVGGEEQYRTALEVYAQNTSSLRKIIVFDENVNIRHENSCHFNDFLKQTVEYSQSLQDETAANINKEDTAAIIYTSGTTGTPKGVMLTHENLLQTFQKHAARLNCSHKDHSLAFLPLSHIYEHGWTLFCLSLGMPVSFLRNPREVMEVLPMLKPTLMCSVPRLYQKIYSTVINKVETSSKFKRYLFHKSLQAGIRRHEKQNAGKSLNIFDKLRFIPADILVFKKLRNVFGGNMRLMPCGGAAVSPEVVQFFLAAGLPFIAGYGLTETTATIAFYPQKNVNTASVGQTLPGVEVKLGENNEILVKGETVMKGYYKKKEETENAFVNGWFRTGDIGEWDESGNLIVTDRLKDLMKTAGGKYIAPQHIERVITDDAYIDEAVVIAEDKPFATALLVPNFEALKKYAQSKNLPFSNNYDLVRLSKVKELYQQKLERLQKDLANFEKVKRFKLLDKGFNMHLNELTPTLKVRRKVVMAKFKHLIDEMYHRRTDGQQKKKRD